MDLTTPVAESDAESTDPQKHAHSASVKDIISDTQGEQCMDKQQRSEENCPLAAVTVAWTAGHRVEVQSLCITWLEWISAAMRLRTRRAPLVCTSTVKMQGDAAGPGKRAVGMPLILCSVRHPPKLDSDQRLTTDSCYGNERAPASFPSWQALKGATTQSRACATTPAGHLQQLRLAECFQA